MLKKFFLNLLSSFIGAWLAIVLGGIVIVLLVLALIGKIATMEAPSTFRVSDNSVLVLELKGDIEETEVARKLDMDMLLSGEMEKPQTLLNLVTALQEAAENPRIKAIYIKCGALSVAPSTAHALHDALADFKSKSKKPIIAYGDMLTQGALYISACADSIFLNPQGNLALTGCGSTGLYLKDLFDNIGIQWQVAKVGTYKSAVEPYTTQEMSEPARRQLVELYSEVWSTIRKGIADGRKVSAAKIDSLTNAIITTFTAEEVVKTGLISATAYEREMDDKIAGVLRVHKEDINYIGAHEFGAENAMPSVKGKHVAVLYATGEIQENALGGIDCYKLVPVITDLADDDDVAALVLRVNSPGGSVFGSQQIADALAYFKSKKKPFVVSMGDYAASGGYWISCDADRIFADPLTITGSIGIFGLVPNGEALLRKIGMSPQTVSTNPNAMMPIPFQPLNEVQMAALQRSIEHGYDQFLTRVATGRHMQKVAVDSIAQGRVWIGTRAKQLGLVDELGSLQQAVKYVAKKADVKSGSVGYYPKLEPSFWDMIPSTAVKSPLGQTLSRALGEQNSPYMIWHLIDILRRNHQQAVLPGYWRIHI